MEETNFQSIVQIRQLTKKSQFVHFRQLSERNHLKNQNNQNFGLHFLIKFIKRHLEFTQYVLLNALRSLGFSTVT